MAEVNDLLKRIDAEFNSTKEKIKTLQAEKLQEHSDREKRLEKFGALVEELVGVWRPRLEALKAKFGDKAQVQPTIERSRRSAHFKFKTDLARVDLRFSVFTDPDVRNLVVSYDLDILPILMKYDSHEETSFPLEKVDREALSQWFDDRVVGFVRTYLSLHENQYYLKGHMVEDPVAKIHFPNSRPGRRFERDGKTHYFIDEKTRDEFAKRAGA